MKEKLLKLIKERHGSDAAFEKAFGLKEKTVDSWRRGNSKAYCKMISELCNHFEISADWLLDIKKPPPGNTVNGGVNNSAVAQGDNITAINSPAAQPPDKNSEQETELIEGFRKLSLRAKHNVMGALYAELDSARQ